MWKSVLAGFAAAVFVGFLSVVAACRAPPRSKGLRELAWPAPMRWFAGAMVPASAGIAYLATQAKPSQAVVAAVVATGFVLGSTYLAYCVFLYRVWWTTEGIGSWHPLGGTQFIPWERVERVRYLASLQAFCIEGAGRRVWYSPMHRGIAHLHRYLGMRLPSGQVALPDQSVSEH